MWFLGHDGWANVFQVALLSIVVLAINLARATTIVRIFANRATTTVRISVNDVPHFSLLRARTYRVAKELEPRLFSAQHAGSDRSTVESESAINNYP